MMKNNLNVGIIDMEIYFPKYYVDQIDLESHDRVDRGKYTIGLGQQQMAFVGDREDINSICLTVLEKLIRRNNIKPSDVGRLEVGTETFLDKSKSIKTHLMDFFKNNNDIEGVTTSNACYGGTNALLNAMNWVTSHYYDGRYAIVIAADIAVYAKGNARPTGGCGSIALLIGLNAPIVFENVRATYMNNVYDFYKPNPSSEYPQVDGVFSMECYFKALESCYENYLKKYELINGEKINLNHFDYFSFHSPFSKMVEKAFINLLSYDLHLNNKNLNTIGTNDYYKGNKIANLIELFSIKHSKLDTKLIGLIKSEFNDVIMSKVDPALFLGKTLGNLYTASLYVGILSIILNKSIDLTGKRLFSFSYGSGCASTLFSLKFNSEYKKIRDRNFDVIENLNKRIKISPKDFENLLSRKEKLYLSANYIPENSINELFDETYYIEKVDEKWRRYYTKKGKEEKKIQFNKLSNNLENTYENNTAFSRLALLKSQLTASSDVNLNLSEFSRKIHSNDNIWTGFHKKSIHERHLQIKKIYPEINLENLKTGGLNPTRADNMIENCIGVLSVPIGLGLHFTINSKKVNIPMAVEEPSVIAACSNAAKLISESNGFFCYSDSPVMISQIYFIDTSTEESELFIKQNISKLISIANKYCQDMVQRGGGVKEIYSRIIEASWNNQPNGKIVIETLVDVRDSMGANTLSTIAEGLASYLQSNIKGIPILKIISNLAIYRKATAEFKINVKNLSYKEISGEEIARRIIAAYEIAQKDPFRCSTHNKGIMNGIDAVALAVGQDWRALESGAHTYACYNNKTQKCDSYRSLTYYNIIEINGEKFLYGNLTMPVACGTVGGAINSNEIYTNMLEILGKPSSQELGQIMVSVGLAQNFAALRALVSEGIQRGHMGLHARNFAIKANVPEYLIPDAVNFMKNNRSISEKTAKNYLDSVNVYLEIRKQNLSTPGDITIKTKALSSFYVEINYPFLKEPILMNFLLDIKNEKPIHLSLKTNKLDDDDIRVTEIYHALFKKETNSDWLQECVKFINHIEITKVSQNLSELYTLKYKVKIMLILLFVCSYNMLEFDFKSTKDFLIKMLDDNYQYDQMIKETHQNSFTLNFGLSVVLELFEVMKFYLMSYKKNKPLITDRALKEVKNSLFGFIKLYEISRSLADKKIQLSEEIFNSFFELKLKRLPATLLILIDLAFSELEITDEIALSTFINIGKTLEIKITLLRDFKRYQKTCTNKIMNSFYLFSELRKKSMTDEQIEKSYFNLIEKEQQNVEMPNNEGKESKIYNNFKIILQNIEKDIEDYYRNIYPEQIKPISKF